MSITGTQKRYYEYVVNLSNNNNLPIFLNDIQKKIYDFQFVDLINIILMMLQNYSA